MSRANRVLRSIETDDGARCVDLFVRPDSTFGFEEYRRDIEDGRGWFRVGHYCQDIHLSQDAALAAALSQVAWLAHVIGTD
jgi:hypothetical protein